MKLRTHLDPVVLERSFLEAWSDWKSREPFARALILVPTQRLADHLERRLASAGRAWLGAEILNLSALTSRILEQTPDRAPRLLSPRLLEALLRQSLRELEENLWSRYAASRPGALPGLLRALQDMRDARLTGAQLLEAASEAVDRDFAKLALDYESRLAKLEQRGWVDESGRTAAALPHAASFAASRDAIWFYGMYELTGSQLALLRELDRGRPLQGWTIGDAEAPAGRYAERFLGDHLLREGDQRDALPKDETRLPLESLFDEPARPASTAEVNLHYRHAQGSAAEIRAAVRGALQAIEEGCPAEEIVIAARTLKPYESALDEILEREALPWTGSLAQPLRHDPTVHDIGVLLRLLDEDFPRRPTAELLRSPRVRWDRWSDDPPRGDLADLWSREAGVVGGLDEWRERLDLSTQDEDDVAVEERQDKQRLIAAMQALQATARPEDRRSWSQHADLLHELFERCFEREENETWQLLDGLLNEMRLLDELLEERRPVSFGEMRRWFDRAIDRSERMPARADRGGIRVLDLMQLRGVTCRRLFLIGMNAGVLPRTPRPSVVLPDAQREKLEAADHPLTQQTRSPDEERLLLAIALGSAIESVDIGWQRADEAGRARTPSLALRECARLSFGTPDLQRCLDKADRQPSHPTLALRWLRDRFGMLSPQEERLLVALEGHGQPRSLEQAFPELRPGLTMLRATERFDFDDPRFDGRLDDTRDPERSLSVSDMERLSQCPLRYFFQRVLRVREFDAEADPFELTPREIGQYAHAQLETTYRRLSQEGMFERPLEERIERAMVLLDESWNEIWGPYAERLSRRAPGLWSAEQARWKKSLGAFVQEDLERAEQRGGGRPETEERLDKELAFGNDRQVRLVGRFDRAFGSGEDRTIGDYKTGSLKDMARDLSILRGEKLQVPLYWMLADTRAAIEVLGIGPRYDPERVDERERRVRFEQLSTEHFVGFLDTMQVLVALLDDRTFPLVHGRHCDWCPYDLACRHQHPPTIERDETAVDRRDFNTLAKKTKEKPRIADWQESS